MFLTWVMTACTGPSTTTRVYSGHSVVGDPIDAAAYEAYLRGVYLQERGELKGALDAFVEATTHDPSSAELWVRVAQTRCRLGRSDYEDAFNKGRNADPNYAPLYRERARCAWQAGNTAAAAIDGELAAGLDPEEEETTRVQANVLEARGGARAAGRWLLGLALRKPDSPSAWSAVLEHARRHSEIALEQLARHTLLRLANSQLTDQEAVSIPSIQLALEHANLDRARAHAQRIGLGPRELARLTFESGFPKLAGEQAALFCSADAADVEMCLLALLAYDQLGDDVRFGQVLRSMDPSGKMSEAGALLLQRILRARVGELAAGHVLRNLSD